MRIARAAARCASRFTRVCVAVGSCVLSPPWLWAQRQPPSVEQLGDVATGRVVPAGVVRWAYWGILLPRCGTTDGVLTCRVPLGNGSDSEHTLCVENPLLLFGENGAKAVSASVHDVVEIPAGTRVVARSARKFCGRFGPHDQVQLVVRSRQPGAALPTVLRLELSETVNGQRLSDIADIPVARYRGPPD